MPAAIFLDRDGVINPSVYRTGSKEWDSPLTPEEFEPFPFTMETLKRFQAAGLLLFLVSNQPAYAKAKTSLEQLRAIHEKFQTILFQNQVSLAEVYYCYHHPKGVTAGYSGSCVCRKPSPYFLKQAQKKFGLDLSKSWMIGDRDADILCGRGAFVRTVRITSPETADLKFRIEGDYTAQDLREAANIILGGGAK